MTERMAQIGATKADHARPGEVGHTPDGRIWIHAELDMPPTDNMIYLNKAAGQGRILLKQGKAYKTKVQYQIGDIVIRAGNVKFPRNVPYRLKLRVFFRHVFSKEWEKHPQTKPRYVKIDSANRVKLIQDAVCTALDLDDSLVFENLIYKYEDAENERIEVLMVQMEHPYGP